MAGNRSNSRRRFLQVAGTAAVAGLAGCGGGDGGDGGNGGNGGGGQLGPVPDEYATADSLDGTTRDPDSLSSKDDVSYQSSPQNGQQCSGCALYIEDKNGDDLGACAVVEGEIEPDGYCVSYVEYEG